MVVHILAKQRPPHKLVDLFGDNRNATRHSVTAHLSYCGRYELEGNEVIHHISTCSFPNWVNTEQRRSFEFDNGRLSLCAVACSSVRNSSMPTCFGKKSLIQNPDGKRSHPRDLFPGLYCGDTANIA